MRLRRPLIMILVTRLLASGIVAGQEPPDSNADANLLANVTLSCSAAAPSWLVGCFVERPVLVLGGLELAVGLDAQAALAAADVTDLAPFGILAYYAPTWSAWAEVRLPELAGVPILGSPDWLRVGFTYRFEEPP